MVITFSGVLTGILLTPVIGAIIILLLDSERKDIIRTVAALTTGVTLLLALGVFFGYNTDAANAVADEVADARADVVSAGPDVAPETIETVEPYFAYEDHVKWVESVGISWHLGVDGIAAAMVLLTAIAGFTGVLISWGIEDRTREFMAFFLLLVAGVFGVFVAVDLFVLFFFYELAIFPMYFLIVIWGWKATRE